MALHVSSALPPPTPTSPSNSRWRAYSAATDYNRFSESLAARGLRAFVHQVRGAPASRLPPLLRPDLVVRDRRQHRARDQLLGHLPGVPLADARRVRGHQPLGAVLALLRVRGHAG